MDVITPKATDGKSDAEPIAIIGIGCRFPGSANTPELFWQLLQQGSSAITEVPPERWNVADYYDPNPNIPGKMVTKWAGLIDHMDTFDAAFFGISPREAHNMDPQQRVFLEVAVEALTNAGHPLSQLARSATGVFVGVSGSEYATIEQGEEHLINQYTATGKAQSIIAGRLSYLLDLRGPSLSIDSACSASLVAVHLACQSLRVNECNMALAGGINLILSPQPGIVASKMGIMAPDGKPKTFDAQANGTVRGEGCGVIVLKRLSAAIADNDHVIALIHGSAINQDGRSSTLTAPNGEAQEALIRLALAQAKLDPAAISYIETHGSGTSIGDPIEVGALNNSIGLRQPAGTPCYLGAVKPNIGHLEAAAGIAGLIKTILALHYESIPPTINFNSLNPNIQFDQSAFVIPITSQAWPVAKEQRFAGVSSFGWAGTNAHVIVGQAPQPPAMALAASEDHAYLLPLSAHTPDALVELANDYRAWLLTNQVSLNTLVYSAVIRHNQHQYRLALVGSTTQELLERIDAFINTEVHPETLHGQVPLDGSPQIVMVFPGQGSQWLGMARQLIQQVPAFQQQLQQLDHAFKNYVNWSLCDVLLSDDPMWIERIDYVQPILCAIQISLAELWRSWGVEPTVVIGHSMGEVAAAYIAGILDLDDTARIICGRSRLMRQLSGTGAMVLVELSITEAQAIVAATDGQIALAVSNSSRSSVLAGDPAVLHTIQTQLEHQGVFCRPIKVDIASHSPLMDPILPELEQLLAPLQPRNGRIMLFSTVEQRFINGDELDAAYWTRNLRQPVYFSTAIDALASQTNTIFLEISPHPLLVSVIETELREAKLGGSALPSLRRNQDEFVSLKATLGALYTQGCPIDWQRMYPKQQPWINLPPIPWQRQRFWLENQPNQLLRKHHRQSKAHPLLGYAFQSATETPTRSWEQTINDISLLGFNHESPVPLDIYFGLCFASVYANDQKGSVSLIDLQLTEPLNLNQPSDTTIHIVLKQLNSQSMIWQLFSRPNTSPIWLKHAQLLISSNSVVRPSTPDFETIVQRCNQVVDMETWYAQYTSFRRVISALYLGKAEIYAQFQPTHQSPSLIVAELIEVLFQVGNGLLSKQDLDRDYRLTEIQQIDGFDILLPNQDLWIYLQLDYDHLCAQAFVYSLDATILMQLKGIKFQGIAQIEHTATHDAIERWLYHVEWEPQTKPRHTAPTMLTNDDSRKWLILSDGSQVAQTLAVYLEHHGQIPIIVTQAEQYAAISANQFQLRSDDQGMIQQLLSEAFAIQSSGCRGIVSFWGNNLHVDNPNQLSEIQQALVAPCTNILLFVKALAHTGWRDLPRFWQITQNTNKIDQQSLNGLGQASLTGLLRSIAHEFPQLQPTLIELNAPNETEAATELFHELLTADYESQIALNAGQRYVSRLKRIDSRIQETSLAWRKGNFRPANQPFALMTTTTGMIALEAVAHNQLKPHEVEIQVGAWYLDSLTWDSLAADSTRISECSGVISALGAEVTEFQLGQAVIGLGRNNSVSHVISAQALVAPKPAHLEDNHAAIIPQASLCGYYILTHAARLQPTDRVLIHCTDDPLGLVTLQLAQALRIDTVISVDTEQQKRQLMNAGFIVADNQSSTYFDCIIDLSSGTTINNRLEQLRPHGRLIVLEAAYRILIQHYCAHPKLRNSQLTWIDPAGLSDQLEVDSALFRDAIRLIGQVNKLNTSIPTMAIQQLLDLAPAQLPPQAVITIAQQAELPMLRRPHSFISSDPHASYLLAGDFNLPMEALAQWLVEQGCLYQAWFSINPFTSQMLKLAQTLQAQGAQIVVQQVLLTDESALANAFENLAEKHPPIRGIIYNPQYAETETMLQLEPEQFNRQLISVGLSAWNLHKLSMKLPLDHFILYSSTASILGAPRQAPQAASSALLDRLAQQRQSQGLPALIINWWGWKEEDFNRDSAHPQQQGMRRITANEGLQILEHVLRWQQAQVCILPFMLRQWLQYYPKVAASNLFTAPSLNDAIANTDSAATHFRSMLLQQTSEQRLPLLEEHLIKRLRQILRLPKANLDRLTPFGSIGLDSLMTLEFRNMLEDDLGLDFPVTLIWNYRSIAGLAEYLNMQIITPTAQVVAITEPPMTEPPAEITDLLLAINDLSLDDLQQLLGNNPLG